MEAPSLLGTIDMVRTKKENSKKNRAASITAEAVRETDAAVDAELEELVGSAARKLTSNAAAVAAAEDEPGPPNQKQKKQKKPRWRDRKSVFVNQIPYTATMEEITNHFAGCCASASDLEVRQVMNRKTKKFKGICFIDFKNDEALQKALALDQSSFAYADESTEGARIVNVRVATDKKDGEKDLTPRQALQKAKVDTSRANIEALVAQAVAAGKLQQSDIDERAVDFLCSVPEDIASTAIAEFGSLDLAPVKNRGAFFMGLLKRRLRGDTNRKIADRTGSAEPAGPVRGKRGADGGGSGKAKAKARAKAKVSETDSRRSSGKPDSGVGASHKRKGAPGVAGKNDDGTVPSAKKGKATKAKDWRFTAKGVCYVCGQEGHVSRSCPKREKQV